VRLAFTTRERMPCREGGGVGSGIALVDDDDDGSVGG
jgi:hypothetical protein